jgi:hypothetical protein
MDELTNNFYKFYDPDGNMIVAHEEPKIYLRKDSERYRAAASHFQRCSLECLLIGGFQ